MNPPRFQCDNCRQFGHASDGLARDVVIGKPETNAFGVLVHPYDCNDCGHKGKTSHPVLWRKRVPQ